MLSRALRQPVQSLARNFSTSAAAMSATLPKLPYAYNALEPAISEQIMTLHHTKHHQTYITNLNAATENYSAAVQAADVKKQIALQSAIKFNGGGHINHSLFWENLAPIKEGGGAFPESGPLADAVKAAFGSVEELKKAADAAALGIQGSGWAWIVYNPTTKLVEVISTSNQDPVTNATVLVGIDMWEHAFYLDYQNVKPNYLKAIWTVINWKEAERRLVAASSKL